MVFPDGPLAGAPLNVPTSTGGAPHRPILPIFDGTGDTPRLAYQLQLVGPAPIEVLGLNLSDIVDATLTDVNDTTNTGAAPTVDSISALATVVTISFDTTGAANSDVWGLTLIDGDGNAYSPPSPIRIFT